MLFIEEFKKEFGQFDRSGFYRQQRKRKQDKVQHWFWLGLYRVQDIVKVWGQFCHESIMCRFCTWGYFWKVFLDFLWLHFLIKKRWQQHENMGRFGLSRVQHIFSTWGYFWKNWWVLKHIVTWFSVGNFGLLHPEALGVFLIWSCTEVIGGTLFSFLFFKRNGRDQFCKNCCLFFCKVSPFQWPFLLKGIFVILSLNQFLFEFFGAKNEFLFWNSDLRAVWDLICKNKLSVQIKFLCNSGPKDDYISSLCWKILEGIDGLKCKNC